MKNIKFFLVPLTLFGVVVLAFFLSFKNPCANPDKLDYGAKQLCWYNQIKSEITRGGVVDALRLLGKLYKKYPGFAQGCHDVTHLIGKEAYFEYKNGKVFNFPEETSWCGYGFYHGFIETMLYKSTDYSEVVNFCESIKNNLKGNIEAPNAIYSCYHGIGHATFDEQAPLLLGQEGKIVILAIKTCQKITLGLEEEKNKQCVTGVFNALANAYTKSSYNLKMKSSDPVWLCRTQKGVNKQSCFMEVGLGWINLTMGNFNYKFLDGVKFIHSLGDVEGEKALIVSLVSDYVHLHQNELPVVDFAHNCNLVGDAFEKSCIEGTELAFLNWGKPTQEYKKAIDFCKVNELSTSSRNACFSYLFKNLQNLYSQEKRVSICREDVPNEYIDSCLKHGITEI